MACRPLTGAGRAIWDHRKRQPADPRLSAERPPPTMRMVQQSLEIIRRRIDEVGTAKPTIMRAKEDRILIPCPALV